MGASRSLLITLIIDSWLYPICSPTGSIYSLMFSFLSGQAASFVYSEAVMAIAVQADRMLSVTESLFLFIKLS